MLCRIFRVLPLLAAAIFAVSTGCERKQPQSPQPSSSNPTTPVPGAPPTIRLLAWVGYDEPDFVAEVERRAGVKLQVKTYSKGGDEMYSLFRAAPEGYDLVVVDAEYGDKLFGERQLATLPEPLWRTSDLFSPFDDGEPAKRGNDVYGAVVRWGAIGLVYNTKHLSSADVGSYGILWDPKVQGRVGVFDWYLPNMGAFANHYLASHPRQPPATGSSFALSTAELDGLRKSLLALRPHVRSIQPSTGDVIADLKSGDVWITPGIGEWAAASLKEQSQPIEWAVPKEGGVMWIECLAIPERSRQQDVARRVITTIRQPELLALLAWRKAYVSQSPSRAAYAHISKDRRALLRAEDLDDVQDLINRLEVRRLPGPAPSTVEADWIRVWNDFKIAR